MSAQSWRIGRTVACGVFSFGLMAGSLMIASGSAAQTIVDPNAPTAGMSNHDAAMAATRRGDYVTALDLAKKAAADGKPLDPDQLDFIAGKAAKQQAAADEEAKTKAAAAAASTQAQAIMNRQQQDYAKKQAQQAAQCLPTGRSGGRLGNDYTGPVSQTAGNDAASPANAGGPLGTKNENCKTGG